MAVHERAVPPPARDQALVLEALQRAADGRAADTEPLGELGLRREPGAVELVGLDRFKQAVARLRGEGLRFQSVASLRTPRLRTTWRGTLPPWPTRAAQQRSGTAASQRAPASRTPQAEHSTRSRSPGARAPSGRPGKTSPEELLAAAHASCYCMALSHELGEAGNPPERLEATATIEFIPGEGVKYSHIVVTGRVSGIDQSQFEAAAKSAGENCPISGALKGNIEITVDATLEPA